LNEPCRIREGDETGVFCSHGDEFIRLPIFDSKGIDTGRIAVIALSVLTEHTTHGPWHSWTEGETQ
jgi:carotenoid cleavage dioxygenase-like enzyme